MVIQPSATYAGALLEAYWARSDWMSKKDVRRSGDQIFLNHFIHSWRALPTTYNAQHGERGIVMHDKAWKNKSGAFVGAITSSPYINKLLSECNLEVSAASAGGGGGGGAEEASPKPKRITQNQLGAAITGKRLRETAET
jgi:hypothetical protein